MDTAQEPRFPPMRAILEARLESLEKDRADAIERIDREIGKVEKQLAAELEIGVTELRKQRKANARPEPDPGIEKAAATWAREDDSPEKACKRIPLLVARVDLELYIAALPVAIRDHADVKGATVRKLATFAVKA